jgi:hypothetical protein
MPKVIGGRIQWTEDRRQETEGRRQTLGVRRTLNIIQFKAGEEQKWNKFNLS